MSSAYNYPSNQINQNIADEFSPNLINYHIEQHEIETNQHYNPAEIEAMKEEQRRYEEELRKQEEHERNIEKYKKNIKYYNIKHSKSAKTDKEPQKINKIQRSKEYNEMLRKNIKAKQKQKEPIIAQHSNKKSNTIEAQQFTEGQQHQSEILDTFSFKNTTTNNDNEPNNIIEDSNETTKDISNQIYFQLTEHTNNTLAFTNNEPHQNENVQDKINQNIQMLKMFRKSGTLPLCPNTIPTNPNNYDNNIFTNNSYNISTQSEVIKTKKVPQPYQHSINAGELQQRRYQKALKKIMIEQLKNKSINIPSICSCGQLQRKIDSLLNEGKSITPNDLMNVDCANNCIYYQKPGEYHKALSDIIQSMRNLNFENPYNK